MFFFLRKKEIVFDCFTSNKATHELFPIDYAKKFYPDWWKKLPTQTVGPTDKPGKKSEDDIHATMKTCPGITDYYKFGFIMPLWSDLIMEVGSIGTSYLRINFSNPESQTQQHPTFQRGSYLPDLEYTHIKLISPWLIDAKTPVYTILNKPIWNYDDPTQIIIPPGSLNFHYLNDSHINLFIKHKREAHKFQLNAGQPLVHLLPLTEHKIKIKTHLISHLEYTQKSNGNSYRFSFIGSYSKYKKNMELKHKQ